MKLKAKHINTVKGTSSNLMYYVDDNGDGRIVFGNGHMLVIVARHEFPSNFALHRRLVDSARSYTEQEPGETIPKWQDICDGCKPGEPLEPKTVEDKPTIEVTYHNTDMGYHLRPLTNGNGTEVCVQENYFQVVRALNLNLHLDKTKEDPTSQALSLTDSEGDFAGLIMPVRS